MKRAERLDQAAVTTFVDQLLDDTGGQAKHMFKVADVFKVGAKNGLKQNVSHEHQTKACVINGFYRLRSDDIRRIWCHFFRLSDQISQTVNGKITFTNKR